MEFSVQPKLFKAIKPVLPVLVLVVFRQDIANEKWGITRDQESKEVQPCVNGV